MFADDTTIITPHQAIAPQIDEILQTAAKITSNINLTINKQKSIHINFSSTNTLRDTQSHTVSHQQTRQNSLASPSTTT
jgi:hypothetical protein